jgi:hypothetical protein
MSAYNSGPEFRAMAAAIGVEGQIEGGRSRFCLLLRCFGQRAKKCCEYGIYSYMLEISERKHRFTGRAGHKKKGKKHMNR